LPTTIRYIDTTGLPQGFDVADLIAQGTTGGDLVAWCKARVRPGFPPEEDRPKPVPKPQAKKSPGDEGVEAGASGAVTEGGGRAATIPTRQAVSTQVAQPAPPAPPPVAATVGNVTTLAPRPSLALNPNAVDLPPQYSDDALAEVFSDRYHEDMLYVSTWGRWMIWGGSKWEHDETLRATDLARRICREHGNEAIQRPDLASKARTIATGLTSARTIGNVERLARSDRRHAATTKQWDHDLWALNTPGGIIDLNTGSMRLARKEDYVTKTTAVAPGGSCPTWMNFLNVATDGDTELQEYMRRVAGYCLTGSTREHAFFFVYGTGGNGKGTFLNMMHHLLDTYSRTASMQMFTENKYDNGDASYVAGLMGARMVVAQEVQEGKRWNEDRLKAFTGGDSISAKFLYSNPFEYVPQFKLLFAGNHKPGLRNVDEAIKRRLHFIPFTVTVPPEKRDVNLMAKLRCEASGILQWAIDGCLDWQRNFLAPPHRVLAATDEYFEEEDSLGNFFEECCDFNSSFRTKTSDVYRCYQRWCESISEYALPRKRWLQQLAHRAMESKQIGGNMVIEGIRLKDPSGPPRAPRNTVGTSDDLLPSDDWRNTFAD